MKNKYKIILLIYCLLSNLGKVTAQTYAEKYNLNFKIENNLLHGWTPDLNNSMINICHNSTYIRFSQAELWNFREKLGIEYYSHNPILLPNGNNQTACIKILYKYKNLKRARLRIYVLSDKEEIVRMDSIEMIPTDTMSQVSQNIELSNARFLAFRIIAHGKDSTYTRGMCPTAQTLTEELCIKELQIIINNKLLNNTNFIDIPPLHIDKRNCIQLAFDSLHSYNKIPLLSSKKIIGLGETVHGSDKIRKAVSEIIKYQITNNHCKLILFEKPLLMMLPFNRYIQGSNEISTEKLIQLLRTYTIEGESMIELIQWIRAYNLKEEEKVKLLGVDACYERNEFPLFATDYLKTINLKLNSNALDSIINIWENTAAGDQKEKAEMTLSLLTKNKKSFIKILGKDDVEMFEFYLSEMKDKYNIHNSYYLRDHGMFKAASFFIKSMPSTNSSVIFYAHLMHLNHTLNEPPAFRSLGSYMKEKYNDDYSCIGLSVYQGNIKVFNGDKLSNNKLLLPPPNSLEYILNDMGYEYAYSDMSSLNGLARLRVVGIKYYHKQFETIIPPAIRMDGMLFIK